MENTINELQAVTYDYLTVDVSNKYKNLVQDTYENLGYEKVASGVGSISFKRDRRINNKKELKTIERKISVSLNTVFSLENSITTKPMIFALAMGIVGALVLGGGMALVMELNMLALGIILGVVGILICLPVYPIYHKMVLSKTNKVAILVEKEYDTISNLCDEAIALQKNTK